MSVHVVAYVTCDTPGCMASHRGPEPRTVTQVTDAALEARMAAQQAGWVVRRLRAGVDLCPACREAAA